MSDPVFLYEGSASSRTMYNLSEMNDHGNCLSTGEVRYRWDFSFPLLYTFVLTWFIWTITMYVLYLDSYLHSCLEFAGRSMGTERAILDLAAVMQKTLAMEDVLMYGNADLKAAVEGERLSYVQLLSLTSGITRWSLIRAWWRDSGSKQASLDLWFQTKQYG